MTFLTALRRDHGRKGAALVLALAAALLLQSFLAVAHVHTGAATVAASVAAEQDAAQKPAHRRAPAEQPASCAICHAVAQSGHYLAPPPIVFALAASATVWLFAAVFRASNPARRSHAWQSRAPPQ